jgi:hypothetical protein
MLLAAGNWLRRMQQMQQAAMVRTRCPASSCRATSWCSTTRQLWLQQQRMQRQQHPCMQQGQAASALLLLLLVGRR